MSSSSSQDLSEDDIKSETYKTSEATTIIHPAKKDILEFDLEKESCRYLSFQETLQHNPSSHSGNPLFILLNLTNPEEIKHIRVHYSLHPLIDIECQKSRFNNTDTLINFGNFIFLTINDASISDEIDSLATLKLIIFDDIVFAFAQSQLYCIEKVFHNEMNFANYPEETDVPEDDAVIRYYWRTQQGIAAKKFELKLRGSSKIEDILYKLIDAIVSRFEIFVKSMDEETKVCFDYSNVVDYKDRSEFIHRVSMAKTNLAQLNDLIEPKERLFILLKKEKKFSKCFRLYIKSMLARISRMLARNDVCLQILNKAENVHISFTETALTLYTNKLNKTMTVFAAAAFAYMPLSTIPALWGMNCEVPWKYVDDTWPFYTLVGSCIASFILIMVFFKLKSLI